MREVHACLAIAAILAGRLISGAVVFEATAQGLHRLPATGGIVNVGNGGNVLLVLDALGIDVSRDADAPFAASVPRTVLAALDAARDPGSDPRGALVRITPLLDAVPENRLGTVSATVLARTRLVRRVAGLDAGFVQPASASRALLRVATVLDASSTSPPRRARAALGAAGTVRMTTVTDATMVVRTRNSRAAARITAQPHALAILLESVGGTARTAVRIPVVATIETILEVLCTTRATLLRIAALVDAVPDQTSGVRAAFFGTGLRLGVVTTAEAVVEQLPAVRRALLFVATLVDAVLDRCSDASLARFPTRRLRLLALLVDTPAEERVSAGAAFVHVTTLVDAGLVRRLGPRATSLDTGSRLIVDTVLCEASVESLDVQRRALVVPATVLEALT